MQSSKDGEKLQSKQQYDVAAVVVDAFWQRNKKTESQAQRKQKRQWAQKTLCI
jgi:hypothetical protein